MLKDTVSQLSADVSALKTEMHQAKDSVSNFSNLDEERANIIENWNWWKQIWTK